MSHPALSLARRALLLGAVAAAGILALDACADAPTAPSPDVRGAKGGTGKPGSAETVLFTGTKNGNMDVYAMNPDGSNVRRLTTDTAADVAPDFAPDNRKFVFARTGADANHSELYTANADGSKQTKLTSMGTFVMQPRYSPDGTKIAFVASVPIYGHEIFTVNADGSGLHRLTYSTFDEDSPSWSPDGQTIVFASTRLGPPSIYTMGADGLNVQLLRECIEGCVEPALNPAGTAVAFGDVGQGSIGVMSLAGQSNASVGPVFARGESRHPTWTKDGAQVLFASSRGIEGTFEVYAGTPDNADPSSVHRLTVFSPGDAQTPSYSH